MTRRKRRLGELRAIGTGPGDLRLDEPGPLHPRVSYFISRRPEAGPFIVVFFARIDGRFHRGHLQGVR